MVSRGGVLFSFEDGAIFGNGWSGAEAAHRWNDGKEASLHISVPANDVALELELTLFPFLVPGKVDQQRIQVSAGGRSLGAYKLTKGGDQSLRVSIPNEVVKKSTEMTVVLGLPDAVSPKMTSGSGDTRQLAIGMRSVSLTTLLK